MIRAMHYHPDDLHRLLSSVPTLRLNRPGPAASFLRAAVDTGVTLAHVLRDYPYVRCQPLDFHYVCQQSLSVLDGALLSDLTSDEEYGWRGAQWAALLIALSGDARLLPYLDASRAYRGVEWTAQLADAACRTDAPAAGFPCRDAILCLRNQLASLPRVAVRLRPALSADALEARAIAVRAAYRHGGADAALPLARR
jgi:hypothetical protein